jgi:aldose sugar dehydrogenase
MSAFAWLASFAAAQEVEPTSRVPGTSGVRVVLVSSGLERPFGMVWLPSGELLITEKPGRLRLWQANQLHTVATDAWPSLYVDGQGGLLDVALHPRFADNGWIYFTAATGDARANRTTVLRGVWHEGRLEQIETLYQAPNDKPGPQHFGSRLLWLEDGTLLVSIGDGGNAPLALNGRLLRDHAQGLDNTFGKVLRLREDGTPAPNNPFATQAGARPELWTYGHRNMQGLTRDPVSGRIYASEHGSRGGDELNVLEPGRNYGWPRATYSREYWGPRISDHQALPGVQDPLVVWTPSIAPSGLTVYRGDRFPDWQGHVLAGGLLTRDVRRIQIDAAGRVVGQDAIKIGARVRDVRVGPDGLIYVITDEARARLFRIEPTR